MLQVSINYIAIDSEYYAGKPRIARTRIPVATIAQLYLKQEETLEAIASEYDLNQAAVYAAMAYYYEHKAEIARQTAESTAWVEEMKRNTP